MVVVLFIAIGGKNTECVSLSKRHFKGQKNRPNVSKKWSLKPSVKIVASKAGKFHCRLVSFNFSTSTFHKNPPPSTSLFARRFCLGPCENPISPRADDETRSQLENLLKRKMLLRHFYVSRVKSDFTQVIFSLAASFSLYLLDCSAPAAALPRALIWCRPRISLSRSFSLHRRELGAVVRKSTDGIECK